MRPVGSNLRQPRFTKHVDRLYPEDDLGTLLEAAELVEQVLAHPGWAVIAQLLETDRDELDAELDTDRPLGSRAEYAALHGRRGGLLAPWQAAASLLARAESRSREADRRLEHERSGESLQRSM